MSSEASFFFHWAIQYGYQRLVAIILAESPAFRFFSIVVIASCGLIAMEDPLETDYHPSMSLYATPTSYTATLNDLNLLMTIAFVVECVVNVVAQGFIWGPRTYLTDSWNQVDFLVVFFGVVEIGTSGQGPNLKGLRSAKVGRVMLYAIRRIPDVRILVELLGVYSEEYLNRSLRRLSST